MLLLTLRTTKRPAETPDPGSAVQIDTLESGRILVSNPDVGVVGDVPNLELNVELRLGAVDGDSPEVFGDVRSLAADDRGTIYVADVQGGGDPRFRFPKPFLEAIWAPRRGAGAATAGSEDGTECF